MVAGRNLFSLDILLPKMSIPVIPGVNIDFGANAGMALDLLLLMLLRGYIKIANFRPMADDVTVPDLEATAGLELGHGVEAGVAAYAGLSAGVPGANVGLGVEGEVELSAPITLNPSGSSSQWRGVPVARHRPSSHRARAHR